jgi:hypothetical protein
MDRLVSYLVRGKVNKKGVKIQLYKLSSDIGYNYSYLLCSTYGWVHGLEGCGNT